jgi:hypothetical protein
VKRLSVVLWVACASVFVSCGVRFSSTDRGTEFFTSIEISGEMRAGAPLTVLVGYEQYYPVEVVFQCELRRHKELIKVLGEEVVGSLENGGPDKTPFPGVISFDFSVDKPGSYIVECLTPKEEDNFIGDEIEIAPAS